MPPATSPRSLDMVHLVIFCRAPQPGQVKTRLIPTLGAHGACELQMECLHDILTESLNWCLQDRCRKAHFFYTPPHCLAKFANWGIPIPPEFSTHPQVGDNLAQRIKHAIATVQAEGDPAKANKKSVVLLIASDLPLLNHQHLEEALLALAHHDVVFGPSPDGGYYLIGTHHSHKWLTFPPTDVLAKNLQSARDHNLSWACISSLPDLDVEVDLWSTLKNSQSVQHTQLRAVQWLMQWARKQCP